MALKENKSSHSTKSNANVRDLEREMVRRLCWLMPLLLGVLFPLAAGGIWALIGLDPAIYTLPSAARMALFALAGLVAGLALCGIWWWSIVNEGRRFTSWRVGLVLAVLMAPVLDAVVRHPRVVDAVWAAVRARTHWHGDFFLREAALFNRMALVNERVSAKPRLQVFGSSQLIMGVDYDLLQELRPDLQIERRSVAGMNPARMLMSYPLVGTREGDTVLVYWSDFDMGGMTTLDADWYRPMGNPVGLSAVIDYLPEGEITRNWRQVIDVVSASYSKLWSLRDGLRVVSARLLGGPQKVGLGEVNFGREADGQAKGYASGLKNEAYFKMALAASEHLVAHWRNLGARVVVLEGTVNPGILKDEMMPRKKETRDWLTNVCAKYGADYIPQEQQIFQPGPGDWRDGTHLSEQGQEAFTRALAEML